jgi:uncharacterized tellurite resistance protein B-like protein
MEPDPGITVAKKRKKDTGAGTAIVLVLAAVGFVVKLAMDYWPVLLALLVACAVYLYLRQPKRNKPDSAPVSAPSQSDIISVFASAAERSLSVPGWSDQNNRPAQLIVPPTPDVHPKASQGSAASISSSSHNEERATAEFLSSPPIPLELCGTGFCYFQPEELADRLAEFNPLDSVGSAGYSIPAPAKELQSTRWLCHHETVDIAGFRIGGFLYVGPSLTARSGREDPALIDPRRQVAATGTFTERHTDYWPSYSELSAFGRRAYLEWLADGKKAPNADIGYVFLYFYGLERRIVQDILEGGASQEELPLLMGELNRLFSIYAEKSRSFKRYCGQLIELLDVVEYSARPDEKGMEDLPWCPGIPFRLRLALAQSVEDGKPISAELALAWAERDPAIFRGTAINRCATEFRKLFPSVYTATHGTGIKVARNRTRLKLMYQPASSGFSDLPAIDLDCGSIPDITALAVPLKKLQMIVDSCAESLGKYSRHLGKEGASRHDLEAVLSLPPAIWPDKTRASLQAIRDRVGNGFELLTIGELFRIFDSPADLGKDKLAAVVRALATEGIGVEPDALRAGRSRKTDEKLVLFQTPCPAEDVQETASYNIGRLCVELAAAVAHADGDFSAVELDHLYRCIDRWEHLTASARLRLHAYAQLLMCGPVALSSIRKKAETLDAQSREEIAAVAATMVLADGVATPEEVRMLEKIYQQLGLERGSVYSNIHSARPHADAQAKKQDKNGTNENTFVLDAAKIAELKESSDRIAERLAEIFTEDQEVSPPAAPEPPAEPGAPSTLLSLDQAHSAFARILITRPVWQRNELLDVAQDLDIMLDGALERINEACLDEFGIPFTEGDEPVEINPEIRENITQ